MNDIIRPEKPVSLFGVPARAFAVVAASNGRILNQRISASRKIGKHESLAVTIRFDDECGNGRESFAITAELRDSREKRDGGIVACGCLHDDIARHFPELAHLIPWHLCSTDGPMHYLANTVYLAGDRDHNGLRAGEARQIRNGRAGEPAWTLEAVNAPGVQISQTPTGKKYANAETVPLYILETSADGEKPPIAPVLAWVPMMRKGEGKARQLDAARRTAIWPDATDAQLCAEPAELRAMLAARLPDLLQRFRTDMEACGFLWPTHSEEGAK